MVEAYLIFWGLFLQGAIHYSWSEKKRYTKCREDLIFKGTLRSDEAYGPFSVQNQYNEGHIRSPK